MNEEAGMEEQELYRQGFRWEWRSPNLRPDRRGQLCRLHSGGVGQVVVEFPDGEHIRANRSCMRWVKPQEGPACSTAGGAS